MTLVTHVTRFRYWDVNARVRARDGCLPKTRHMRHPTGRDGHSLALSSIIRSDQFRSRSTQARAASSLFADNLAGAGDRSFADVEHFRGSANWQTQSPISQKSQGTWEGFQSRWRAAPPLRFNLCRKKI